MSSRRRSFVYGLLCFGASFAVVTCLLPRLLSWSGKTPRVEWMPRFEVPGDDSFFVYSTGDELSHLVLYHNLGDSIENARRADILFLGNSRMPLGLREEVIVSEAEKLGLRVFSLATGHAEKLDFDLALIRKYDLHPKIVVAVGGPNYFKAGVSKRAAAAMKLTRWQAWKEWTEASSAWTFQRMLHSWLPKIDCDGQDLTSPWIIYRSSRTGWWRPALEPPGKSPVKLAREDDSYRRLLPEARKLKKELDARHALLVLTMVPYAATRSGHIPYLSHELAVPAVLPSFDGLFTREGSHLTRESGERYAKAFWDQFIALPAVRKKLSLGGPPADAAADAKAVDTRLQATRAAVLQMRSMLEKYYGGLDVLRKTWYLQPGDPRYDKGIGFLADKIARAFVWRDRFVIGTIGSSVTAGFDNCHFDTYQKQLERLMAPIWTAAGVAFEVRNTGQGGDCGDSFDNQVWCLRTLVGDDVDMTQYSWTYFESGSTAKELQLYHELFYRWSLLMGHSPVPQIIYTGDCTNLSALDQKLLDAYGPFGADVLCMERGIKTRGYPGKKWGEVGDTLHDTTRYGEAADVSAERRRSLGVVFRDWHPGPLLFQTTADALALKLSDAMLLALDRIESEKYPAVHWPQWPRLPATSSLPKPLACPAEWCGGSEAPRCLDYEEPTFGEQHFRRLEPDDRRNPHRGLADPSDSGWKFWKEREDLRYIPKAERHLPECAHPARCAGLIAPPSQQAGWLTVELPNLAVGFVAVCCSKKKCGRIMLDAGAEFLLDGKPPAIAPEPIRNGKCVRVQSRFASHAHGKRRTVHLGIRLPVRKEPIPAITQVIGL